MDLNSFDIDKIFEFFKSMGYKIMSIPFKIWDKVPKSQKTIILIGLALIGLMGIIWAVKNKDEWRYRQF